MVRQWFAISFGIIQFIVEYLYACFIHDTHIVFHISFLMYFCSQIRRVGVPISNFQLLEDLDIIEAAHGRHNNTNEPGTEFVACMILDGTSMLIAMLMVVLSNLCALDQPLRKTQFVMCGTNNVRYFRLFWWHLLESTLIESGCFSCCFTACALFVFDLTLIFYGNHFDRWIIGTSWTRVPMRVHLLQLLIPSGLTSDEPVRNYMRSVQQAWEMDGNGRESCFCFFSWTIFLGGSFWNHWISSCQSHVMFIMFTKDVRIRSLTFGKTIIGYYRLLSSKLAATGPFVTEDFGNHHHYSCMMFL